jgi:hypothetical protein
MCDTRTYTTLQCNQVCEYIAQSVGLSHTPQACDVTAIFFAGDTEDGADVYISKTSNDKGSRYSVTTLWY